MSPELISILALVALFVVGTVLPIKWPFGAHQPKHSRHMASASGSLPPSERSSWRRRALPRRLLSAISGVRA
jgi:hypothetical protein